MTQLPSVKLKALVSFPATVLDGTGIDVTKSNGTYRFDIDFGDFAPPTVISNLSNLNALLWNSSTGQYTLATAASLTGTGGGAPAGGSLPLMNGAAAVGVATPYSREDHVHPSDTSRATVAYVDAADALRATLASPVFSGNPTAPTPAAADNDTSIATTAFITNASVRNDLAQSLSAAQKAQAQNNIFTLPTTQSLTSGTGATYTPTAAGVLWIEVFMVGGGGGGAGGSTSGNTTVAGSAGGTSTFNSVNAVGGGGAGGSAAAGSVLGGAGGTGGTGAAKRRSNGGNGQWGFSQTAVTGLSATGQGGVSYFGAGGNSVNTGAGNAAAANSGAGGSGAQASAAGSNSGAGGGAGEFVYLILPATTYTYTVGTSGAGGVSTNNGGAGGTGFIFIVEHYGS